MSQVKFGTIQWEALVQVGPVSLTTDVSGVLPVANGGNGTGSYTNGQILIGNTTGNTLAKATLTGTANQVIVTNGGGSITLSLPQSIDTVATPQFGKLGLGGAAGTALLTFPSNTVAAGGITFGDTNLYRFGTTTLKTDGDFTSANYASNGNVSIGSQMQFQSNAATSIAYSTASTIPIAYNSSTAGASYPFLEAGNFIVQSRASVGRDILLVCNVSGTQTAVLIADRAGAVQLTGAISKYKNIATVSGGVPAEYATVDLTGQTANIGATTLYSVPASGAGMYRVSAYVVLTTTASVSSTLPNVQIVYTDNQTNTSITIDATPVLGVAGIGQTGALTANTVGTTSCGVIVVNAKSSTNIQYTLVNYASSLAGMAYAVHLKLEAM